MNMYLFLFIVLLFVSCNNHTETEKELLPSKSREDAPYLWHESRFPKKLEVSPRYDESEKAAIESSSSNWKTAVENKKTFFATDELDPLKVFKFQDLNSLYDGRMAIYKVYDWPKELHPTSLGVTQLFGYRYNVGKPSEFVDIVHADILINFDHFHFDTRDGDERDGFDLQSVIIHELGHFLGLEHIPENDDRDSSVMYPYLMADEIKRIPLSKDISELAKKYKILVGEVSEEDIADSPEYEIDEEDTGIRTRIVIELLSSGECIIRKWTADEEDPNH